LFQEPNRKNSKSGRGDLNFPHDFQIAVKNANKNPEKIEISKGNTKVDFIASGIQKKSS
jgi:hypothetical protein